MTVVNGMLIHFDGTKICNYKTLSAISANPKYQHIDEFFQIHLN